MPSFLCCFLRKRRSGGRKGGRAERRREAVVGGASFKAVGSALLVAEMSANFLQFADHFPTIGTDILTRLGELLRVRFLSVSRPRSLSSWVFFFLSYFSCQRCRLVNLLCPPPFDRDGFHWKVSPSLCVVDSRACVSLHIYLRL